MAKKASKKIKYLEEHEHVLKRPTVYVGSVAITDETVFIVKDGKIHSESRQISVGMYKLFDEVFSNSVDEAKRMNRKMNYIKISVDSNKNRMTIEDTGDGFEDPAGVNEKTGITNVATAMSRLKAGSNFENEDMDINETLIGTNGLGVSLVNVLSSDFSVETTNDKTYYKQTWHNFNPTDPIIKPRPKTRNKGTIVSFVPRKNMFENSVWEEDIIKSMLILKKRALETEDETKKMKIILEWDRRKEEIKSDLSGGISYKTLLGELFVWESSYEGSSSVSFVNSAICTGIHQKIIADLINSHLDDSLGHHFYDFLLVLNLKPKLVLFRDQNKTRFATKRELVEPPIVRSFASKILSFTKTTLFKSIKEKVDARKKDNALKNIRREKKKVNVKNSHKYFPATSRKPKNLFIVEGNSARGSILQKRNPREDGVYTLKGKVKNVREIGDLENREILELMQILNLDTESPNTSLPYENIVIAADQDPDGFHITSLLINLFYRWFPWVVEGGNLYSLETPLLSIGNRKRDYFYDLNSFSKYRGKKENVRYLKGLGSLDRTDWEYVMKNKRMVNILTDRKSMNLLEIAFGKSSQARKEWLSKVER